MALNRSMLSSDSTLWGTPRDFYEWLAEQFAFTIDVCALPTNKKHRRFFSPADNGLAQSWEGETAWCNPPYGRGIGNWLDKGRDEAMHARALAVFLVPARPDTDWWNNFVMSHDGRAGRLLRSSYHVESRVLWLRWEALITGVYFHDERVAFEGMDSEDDAAPFPSAIIIHAHPSRRPPAQRPQLEEGQRLLTLGWPR
ncbi:MAG: DNA N-6-adenine-methyltransferase [Myxococcota bacterium]